jgi:Family of unknown function (DUF5677)
MTSTSEADTPKQRSDLEHFKAFEQFMLKASTARMEKGRMLECAIKASLAKCYEFNLMVRNAANDGDAFFWLPGLRGICEDLIVLNYIKTIEAGQREELLGLLIVHDVHSRVHRQTEFFNAVRPQQQVLGIKNVKAEIADIETKIRKIWNANGWPNLDHGSMPQIFQIADKQGAVILLHVYNYLYRMASGMVHFSMQTLLRTGWGTTQDTSIKEGKFSTTNFSLYYKEVAELYGAYMFCCYFELFNDLLMAGKEEQASIDAIREAILGRRRWPEMVTFEEMNMEPPKFSFAELVLTVHQASENRNLLT